MQLSRPRRRTTLLFALCLLLQPLAGALSAQTTSSFPALLVQPENTTRDVREQAIAGMLLARDGYLWLGTHLGLVRFDGVTFTNFGLAGANGATTATTARYTLWEDAQGAIWAGSSDQGVLRYDHGHFSQLTTQTGLPANLIERIDGDETGAVWIYTSRGLVRVQGTHRELVDPIRLSGSIPVDFRSAATFDAVHFGLWRKSSAGIERFAYGHWRPFPLPPGYAADFSRDLRNIYEDTLHRVWFALLSQRGRYFCVEGETLRTFDGVPPDAFVSYQDRGGYLWLTDHLGHTARWKQGRTISLAPVTTPAFLQVVERHDGSFWVASGYSPLTLLRPRTITTLPTAGTPEVGSVLFRSHTGKVWSGGVGLERLTHLGLHPVIRVQPPQHYSHIFALSQTSSGKLLYSERYGVRILQQRGSSFTPEPAYAGAQNPVLCLLLDTLGQQWLATARGLLLAKRDDQLDEARLVTPAAVNSLLETTPGHLWAGTQTGLLEIQDGVVQPSRMPWKFGNVLSLAADTDGSLWVGTTDGLVLVRDHTPHLFSQADGLPTNVIGTIQAADPQALWLKTDAGLLRVERRSLEQRLREPSSDLSIRSFGSEDGLPSNLLYPFGDQGSLAFPDGTLWFSTTGGIASLNPSQMPHAMTLPHSLIEEHVIDQAGLLPDVPIVMPPRASSLEIHYTALGSDDPAELKFRYRLRGIDPSWIQAGQRRVAYYTHLPPGTYSFEVQAANGDGDRWDQPGAGVDVYVQAPWYRTTLFRVLSIGLVLAALLWMLWRRQRRELAGRQLRQAFTRRLLASQETERKRIAHDLHDSLGQHLAVINNLAQPSRKIELSQAASDRLNQIRDEADTALQEVEHIAYNLRPYQLDRLGLTNAVLSLVRGLEEAASLAITCDIANIDQVLPKDLEINFYRIVQETLSNIARHSGANNVSIHVSCSAADVRLRIHDDGVGFSSADLDVVDSLGLVGINERAEVLGGTAIIESAAGQGTTIIVEINRKLAALP